MNILYTLNDGFVPQVGAGIVSVCENNKEFSEITFYIISYGIQSENKKLLKKLVKGYHRNIKIIELERLDQYFDFEFDTLGWNEVILARILMGKILDSSVSRVLYLDGDTIVRGSLEELWNMDLGNKILGMSIEPTVDPIRKKELGLLKYPYFNSGVLLVDLEKWRMNECDKKIIQFYQERNGKLFAADQDAINAVMKDDIKVISPKYNFYNIFYQYPYSFMKKLMGDVPYIEKEVYEDAFQNPCIIHYLGEDRPWRIGNTHKYRKDYIKYLKMTPWEGNSFEDGWRLYFVCFRIFNVVTKPIPMVRYKIMNRLIPKFMDYRAKQKKK